MKRNVTLVALSALVALALSAFIVQDAAALGGSTGAPSWYFTVPKPSTIQPRSFMIGLPYVEYSPVQNLEVGLHGVKYRVDGVTPYPFAIGVDPILSFAYAYAVWELPAGENDMTLGFQQVAADLRGSYTLGFYAPEAPDEKWHKLKVQVKRSGIEVRHREGYLFGAAPPQTPDWTNETWSAAFSNPVGSSAIQLTASLEPAPGGERLLNLTIGVDRVQFRSENGDFTADLRVAVGELTAEGLTAPPHAAKLAVNVPASKWEESNKTGIPFHRQWKPAPDATRLRVVVLDANTGQYGSVDLKLP